MIRILLGALCFMLFLSSCSDDTIISQPVNVIPTPVNLEEGDGQFIFDGVDIKAHEQFQPAADLLVEYLGGEYVSGKKPVIFALEATIEGKEGYQLSVKENRILVSASHKEGALRAVQTIRQLLPDCIENGSCQGIVAVTTVEIEDRPAFDYRGVHLDVCRHFFPADYIKKYIDRLALLKMNTFHWHLTEDQGWRIEIKKYPKLQEVAAYRDETLIGHYSDQPHKFDGKRYGGYYTQEEVKDIVAYATARGITVIPEIEMPGHSQAAIAAYPHLGCTGEQVPVATKWGIFEDIYCPKEETFAFLEDVLDEVMPLFPGKYIHIGGDEAPKTRWKACPHCQKLIKKEGLKDEHELQNYFITRMEKYINSKGKQIIGWDEILEGGLAPNATVMSWRGTKGAVDAAKMGHNVILTPGSHCYFDHYQSDAPEEPTAIGGYTPLEKVHDFDPIPEELDSTKAKYVLGGQANVWTEYIPTTEHVDYMLFPRLLAMSEVLWTHEDRPPFKTFVKKVMDYHNRMDAMDINYANHLYELLDSTYLEDGKHYFQLSCKNESGDIYYTLDGTEPTTQSKAYTGPLLVSGDMKVRASAWKDGKKMGATLNRSVMKHNAMHSKVTLSPQPSTKYDTGGAQALVNGVPGHDKRFGDKEWLGWYQLEPIEITLDLPEEKLVENIRCRFHNGQGQWIYAPSAIEYTFDNGQSHTIKPDNTGKLVIDVGIALQAKTKRIKMKITPYGTIPEGKQGGGHTSWTFVDEIIVR